jgi:hypothetical protein
MIAQRVHLDLTPRQAELVLEALREDLAQQARITRRREESDYVRIRSVITAIKEQGVV